MSTRRLIEKRCKELRMTIDELVYRRQAIECPCWELWVKDRHGELFCVTGADFEELNIELEDFEEDLKLSV